MIGEEVVLLDMLNCREERAFRQQQFLSETNCPLISFSMNIPGPIKTNAEIQKAFFYGKDGIQKALADGNFEVKKAFESHERTGDELLYAVDGDAEKLKDFSVEIEEKNPLGRLFDIDVIKKDGKKISRPSQRRCLICNGPAQDCAHSRRHSVSEMQDKIEEILQDFFDKE